MHQVADAQVAALLDTLGSSLQIGAPTHSLLIYEQGGNTRGDYLDMRLGEPNPLLFVGSPLWFPLNLLPSHYALIGVRQPALLSQTFDAVATQNMTAIIYASKEFESAFLARLRRPIPWFGSYNFRDLLGRFGDDWFAIDIYQGYEQPFMSAETGSALPAKLRGYLEPYRWTGAESQTKE
jgi:hypothetical protein